MFRGCKKVGVLVVAVSAVKASRASDLVDKVGAEKGASNEEIV